jgi:hypothetical protein
MTSGEWVAREAERRALDKVIGNCFSPAGTKRIKIAPGPEAYRTSEKAKRLPEWRANPGSAVLGDGIR